MIRKAFIAISFLAFISINSGFAGAQVQILNTERVNNGVYLDVINPSSIPKRTIICKAYKLDKVIGVGAGRAGVPGAPTRIFIEFVPDLSSSQIQYECFQ
jgi:hypothetical protein